MNPRVPQGDELPRVRGTLPGVVAQALVESLSRTECPGLTARRRRREEASGAAHDPIVWSAARGANVVDVDGNVYVDLTGGFGAALLGHSHPAVVGAIRAQSERMIHALGDVYPSDVKIALEARLASMAPWPARVILGLSGADAVEAALKTARLATGRSGVVAFEGGYHGLSYGALAVCGYKQAFRAPFGAQVYAGVRFAPFPDGARVTAERALDAVAGCLRGGDVGAVIVEPVQVRGGVNVPPAGFLRDLAALTRSAGAVLVTDEIYTGLGRTGATLRAVSEGCVADVVCLGKALGGGVAVSACLMREEIARAWGDSVGEAIHTSTFLGNPIACAAALASLDAIAADDAQAALRGCGHALAACFEPLRGRPELGVTRVDAIGALVGIGLRGGFKRTLAVMRAMLERGLIVLPGGVDGDVLTLSPPCSITRAQLEAARDALTATLLLTSGS